MATRTSSGSRKTTTARRAGTTRALRADGAETRRHILDTAGRVYAEKGFARTTSKEVCARAGVNMAAVNYHFGGKDGLYEAVLVEAHRQIVSLDELQAIADSDADAAHKLRSVIGHLVGLATQAAGPWGVRVLIQELSAPSPLAPALIKRAVQPKARLILGLVGEIIGLPPDHPVVQRALAFAVLPCAVLVLLPRHLRGRVLPALDADPAALLDDLMRYELAGLAALAKEHRGRR
ncbi:MAG TPA: TetR/AcrR family transcriptional regulator [Burkholderiaceae bacterium]